ncbi:flavin-containing monooxygenase [Paractinoplanes rishiriensis]|uniref:Oxidoreductase n=1 Tax=Paractinoplanes rishiriensis TaxID=1050105 RepID=A0A919JYS0_9ACTN|nr:NAD(P)-binding domain-containing protein [Actinoplanes rishiriensis]GIE97198.1 oxidoreductase [Actinoplanes rishiriensis]
MDERVETVIIGAGQAGLATGYHLRRSGRNFVILEAAARIGDVWRTRFDSLRLYSPAWADGLPGYPFPAPRWCYPTKDQMADYLEAYARRFALPVRTGTPVGEVTREGDGYLVTAGPHRIAAAHVVVASGTFQRPVTPSFAGELDPAIRQLHSAAYRNPDQLAEGPVLVVGASHSGCDIALEAARTRPVVLAGRDRGQIPFRPESATARVVLPVLVLLARYALTVRHPLGRRMRREIRAHGGPHIRVKRADLAAAGVERVHDRVTGVRDGRPVLAGGRVLDVATVVWCTGFDKDSSWLRLPVAGPDGWPEQVRGATRWPGLYFVGLPFLHSFASMLVSGAGADARRVAGRISRTG